MVVWLQEDAKMMECSLGYVELSMSVENGLNVVHMFMYIAADK